VTIVAAVVLSVGVSMGLAMRPTMAGTSLVFLIPAIPCKESNAGERLLYSLTGRRSDLPDQDLRMFRLHNWFFNSKSVPGFAETASMESGFQFSLALFLIWAGYQTGSGTQGDT